MNRSLAPVPQNDLHPRALPIGPPPGETITSDLDPAGQGKWGRPHPGKDPRSRSPERMAGMMRRGLAGFVARCLKTNPELGLTVLWAHRAEAEAAATDMVVALRRLDPPMPWEQIGTLAGMTAQGAHLRWAAAVRESEEAQS